MRVLDILTADRVSLASEAERPIRNKQDALHHLARLLGRGQDVLSPAEIEQVLVEREKLQSTGVGGGVAIPHGAAERLDRLLGAVLLCPSPIEFDAIDGEPVSILFAVVGPKRATGEHLKSLARVSKLLRDDSFRERLLQAASGADAFKMIAAEEGRSSVI
jgi:nitrogen PTS system EIIA component